MREVTQCKKNGDFIDPCWPLAETVQGPTSFSRGRGVFETAYVNTLTRKQSARFYIVRSGRHADAGGLVLDFCPFCGTYIRPDRYCEDVEHAAETA